MHKLMSFPYPFGQYSIKGLLSKRPYFKQQHPIAPHIACRTELMVLQSLVSIGKDTEIGKSQGSKKGSK